MPSTALRRSVGNSKPETKKIQVTCSLESDLIFRLDSVAAMCGVSRSKIVKQCFEQGLNTLYPGQPIKFTPPLF